MKKITAANANKLIQHPTRVQIVTILAERPRMSPNQLADEIGETLGTTSYHVRVMKEFGAIKLVDQKTVRGAIEHFYSLNEPSREPIKKALERAQEIREAAEKAFATL